ncbi:MAG TPA: tetratricopeptide repeat protein [Bryobacteraceae bacterium]|jgi:tetratricopeptide (TPR) repeat protein|nr:tetratricopeptide repeat protein [Bryobacteraceae bacterium]
MPPCASAPKSILPLLPLLLFGQQFDAAFREGLIALNANDLPLAQSRLETAAKIEPRNARVQVALAQTYWKLHRPLATESAVRAAEALAGGDAVAGRTLSLFFSEAGDRYYFEVAQAHLERQEFAAALDNLDTGCQKFPASAQLVLARGVALYGLRRFPEAIDAFLRTIELAPDVEQPYAFLGRMLDQAEDRLPRIAQVFAAFAQRAPGNYLASYLYGKALALTGDTAAAESWLRKSLAVNDNSPDAHFELGVLLESRRQFDAAARELHRAAALNPRDPVPHYHLARIYDRLGKPAEAQEEREIHARLSAAAPGVK